ncbi:MAG: cation diffusion facilitator family transporter [Halobacteriales archaeon]
MSRRKALRRVAVVVLVANAGLAALKGVVWWSSGSLAVGSEAVNSLADTAYSLIVVGGIYLTTRPPDPEHPHGHERIEPFVSIAVALGIVAAGTLVARQAVVSFLGSPDPAARSAAVAVLAVSAVAKYGLYRYALSVGEAERSPATVATALDNRTDILTASAALVGVIGARAGYPVLDPVAAGVVSVGILYTGFEVARSNVTYLVGGAPSEELREEILRRALDHPQVRGAHDVVSHYVGPEVDVSLHIEVEGDRTLREAHDIESDVVEAIQDLPEIDDVFVHVDPRELGEWKRDEDVDRLLDGEGGDRDDVAGEGDEGSDRDDDRTDVSGGS